MSISRDDPFFSAKRRLLRAKSHAADMQSIIKDFVTKGDPGEVLFEPDETDDSIWLHKFRFKECLPDEADDAAADAIFNLRAALDNATFTVALLKGVADPKSAKFPFGDASTDVENDIRRGCKDLPPEIVAILRGFEPYKGANDALWSLNKLCNSQKHRLLIPLAMNVVEHGIGRAWKGAGDLFAPEWDSQKNEVVFGQSPAGEDLDYNVNLTMFVEFGEIDTLRGITSFDAIDSMADQVTEVIDALETECRNLKLIA